MNNSIKKKADFTEGPIFTKMLAFVLPLVATSMIQVLYNAADKMVVGQFSGDPNALAAIGSTGSITAIVVNLLIGVSGGAGVLVAQYYGAKNEDAVRRTVSTAMIFSLIGGIVFMIIGFAVAEPLVHLVSKAELYDSATLYVLVTFIGVPALSIYNFGSAILRAKGDSRTPLIIGIVSGLVNVGLNLIFVIYFNMSVAGVAAATVVSQYLSAAAVVAVLVRARGECYGLDVRFLIMEKRYLLAMLGLGIPAGIQSSIINVANMVCNATFNNAFPVEVLSASSVAGSMDIVAYTSMGCFSQAVMTFVGQNWGAGKIGRVRRSLRAALIQVCLVGFGIGALLWAFGPKLSELFVDPEDPMRDTVIAIAKENWFDFLGKYYFIHGTTTVLSGFVRGLGYSVSPSVATLVGEGAVKVVWMLLIFPLFSYSVKWYTVGHLAGWLASLVLMSIITAFAFRKLARVERA